MNNLKPPEGNLDKKLQYFAKFETEKGDFTAILYPNEAPLTVENLNQYLEQMNITTWIENLVKKKKETFKIFFGLNIWV